MNSLFLLSVYDYTEGRRLVGLQKGNIMGGQPNTTTRTSIADRQPNGISAREELAAPTPGRRGRRGVIDSYDLGLMDLLSLDGRASTKFLAEQVGLTDATVAARLRELMDRDVVRVRAVVDWDRAGLKAPMAFFIRVSGRSVHGLADELLRDAQVLSVANVFGSADLVVRVLLADPSEAMTFADHTLGVIDGVETVMSLLDVDVVKHANGYHTGAARSGDLPTFPGVSADLDAVDVRLLGCLVDDARQSLRQIGRILEVSEHTVRARLKRLEDSGLIKIHAQIDPNAINGNQELAYVALRAQNAHVQRVIDEMVDRNDFWTVDRTVGEYNVLALAHAATREQLAEIVDEIRSGAGIERSETWALSSLQLSAFPWGRFSSPSGGDR